MSGARTGAGPWLRPSVATMTALKSIWASVQGDPKLMRRVNGWLTLFWMP